ncbi:MAG: 3-isopropylmalate dehydratase large subunit [Elusimicrobiota bacterium]
MGMTITEKILAKHANKKIVHPGEFIEANVDIALGNDITAPIAIKEFKDLGLKNVFDKNKIALVPDHFTPNKDIKSAEQAKILRDFSKEYGITHYYDQGIVGVEHALLPEQGVVVPGDLVIGADSHTCTYGALGAFSTGVGSTDLAAAMATGKVWLKVPQTIKFEVNGKLGKWVYGKDIILYIIGMIGVDGALYKAMEFTGDTIKGLHMSDRMTICNMAIEAGGKSGIIAPDNVTEEYVKTRAERKYEFFSGDSDASYEKIIKIKAEDIEPQVSFPHLPSNARPVSKAGDIKLDQVVIGSCTNGRIEDLRIAAQILKGKRVNKDVRCLIIPATPEIYKQALEEGLFAIFLGAQAIISPPTCGPCLGGHMGILAKGERALATTNRNFVGRMGHPESEVYLSNPAIAAASAIAGKIVSPEDI